MSTASTKYALIFVAGNGVGLRLRMFILEYHALTLPPH